MKKLLSVALATAIAATALAGVSSATAATVFGSSCAATQVKEGAVWISTAHPDGAFPVTAPTSGVITEWLVNTHLTVEAGDPLAAEFPRIHQQRLLVLRGEGAGGFKVVGEAPGGPLNPEGTNTYLARVPVQQGDYLGIAGSPYAAYCNTGNPADTFDFTVGGTPVGSTFAAEHAAGLQVPIAARIEPDGDGDGYGDETQDRCPQSAAYQTPCPVVTVSWLSLSRANAVTVYVASSLPAPVAVSGIVRLGKGRKTRLAAPGQTVAPGTLGRFRLALTKPVRKTLRALTRKKSLTLTVSASATNVLGPPSTATSKLRLRGRRKTVHRKNAGHKHHKQGSKAKRPGRGTPTHH